MIAEQCRNYAGPVLTYYVAVHLSRPNVYDLFLLKVNRKYAFGPSLRCLFLSLRLPPGMGLGS